MTAEQLIKYLSWAVYSGLFLVTFGRAVRQPRRINISVALFFAVPFSLILISSLQGVGVLPTTPFYTAFTQFLVLGFGFLLLHMTDAFSAIPRFVRRGSAVIFVVVGVALLALQLPEMQWIGLVVGTYMIVVLAYAAVAFVREAQRPSSVQQRRMRAVAIAVLLLTGFFILATLGAILTPSTLWPILVDLFLLGSSVFFYLGFTPPLRLRRAWQEPELRAFLSRVATLPQLPDTEAILRNLEAGANRSLGATGAAIGLWDSTANKLLFPTADVKYVLEPTAGTPAARAFREQKPIFEDHMARDYPELSQQYDVATMLVAPISAGSKHLGVLSVYSSRPPAFVSDDLALVQLLADQAAVILESRSLIDATAHLRANEATSRLKEDFLSAAAHDLKTPLTTLVARAQFLERQARRSPEQPADLASIQLMVREGQRMKRLVGELIDASQAERGTIIGPREPIDLVVLAQEICMRYTSARHPGDVVAGEPVIGEFDALRIEQLLENLVENAVKFSPHGGAFQIAIWREEENAHLMVRDKGIGISTEDLKHIFERFYRAGNVDDRRFAGMGLGLFISKAVVEQHGGRIWATSRPGEGSTFEVVLPIVAPGATLYA